ncbi:hypothetical protein TrLO_g11747 [Triparma laevis f. longispina]|uniref:Transaldolase n=1 Tax=Triparma laevis f. longispina TaxID=1714387 RepID=A0A9W7BZX9_9STRA|nr:hypothetical protein TrLO_g11747 [Triparma laevis f. longispina]
MRLTLMVLAMLMANVGHVSAFVPRVHVYRLMQTSSLNANQLEQLAALTTISIDSGDLKVIEKFADTKLITDATTNPLFVAQAGLSGDPTYQKLTDDSVAFALSSSSSKASPQEITSLAMDTLAVTLGSKITTLVPGYVSTEVDPRLSYDTEETLVRARRIIQLYEEQGVPKSRILVKIAATWEGVKAAEILEKEGITCNLTLIFSHIQAVACAQVGSQLISPFPGRILDWHNARRDTIPSSPADDEGVIAVKKMHQYFRSFNHRKTILMPASWRPSRGKANPEFALDEIRGLAGVDRMTIPAPLLNALYTSTDPLPPILADDKHEASLAGPEIGNGGGVPMDEATFRAEFDKDACGKEKLEEGLSSFIDLTNQLEGVMKAKVEAALIELNANQI